MPGQITAFDIGECMVKAACFTGGKLKKVMAKELPDNMVSGGEIVSMDAMADFIKEMAKENGISAVRRRSFCPARWCSPAT